MPFQLEILTRNGISDIVYFRKIILESSRNVSTPPHECHQGHVRLLLTRAILADMELHL